MIIKTQSLTARALDWAVGVAVGEEIAFQDILLSDGWKVGLRTVDGVVWRPTTSWGQLGPLLEDNLITVTPYVYENGPGMMGAWIATKSIYGVFNVPDNVIGKKFYDNDYKVAACRAIVAAKLGDQVDVPEVLV